MTLHWNGNVEKMTGVIWSLRAATGQEESNAEFIWFDFCDEESLWVRPSH